MLDTFFRVAVAVIEVAGVSILLAGLAWASVLYLRTVRQPGRDADGHRLAFRRYRANIGRAILLCLEFLVAADIIKTVAMELTLESVGVLAGVVLVRTFLSFALLVEIEGRWPWRNEQVQDAEGL